MTSCARANRGRKYGRKKLNIHFIFTLVPNLNMDRLIQLFYKTKSIFAGLKLHVPAFFRREMIRRIWSPFCKLHGTEAKSTRAQPYLFLLRHACMVYYNTYSRAIILTSTLVPKFTKVVILNLYPACEPKLARAINEPSQQFCSFC